MSRDGDGVPRTPEEFGAELKRLRENAGVSLEDIVSETKIGIGVLRNLEAGRFAYLPERVFSRNFVRQFGEAVGFDPDTLAQWFDIVWERFMLTSGSHPAITLAEPEPQRTFKAWMWGPILLGVGVLSAVLILLGLRLWAGSSAPSEGEGVAGLTPARQRTTAPVSTVTPPPSPAVPATAPVPADEGAVVVEVHPGEECWIRTRDSSGRLQQRLLQGGERVRIPLKGWLQLTLGNAGGATVRVGETVYDSLGARGEVVHLEVRPSGMKRLSGAAAVPSADG